jgi:Anti-sigma factor NepR
MSRQPCVTNPATRNLRLHFLFPLPDAPPKPAADLHSSTKANMARSPAPPDRERPDRTDREPASEGRRSRIGDVLRRAYDDALAEPVPDAFADLLRKLD